MGQFNWREALLFSITRANHEAKIIVSGRIAVFWVHFFGFAYTYCPNLRNST